jgi:hypothetical protein
MRAAMSPISYPQRFRLKSPIIAVAIKDGRRKVLQLPAGSEITVLDGIEPIAHNRMVSSEWNGELIQVFAVDVYERGERF